MQTTVRAEPNVTPMIDVMLVLLIVFMVAAPMLMSGVALEPPRGVNLTAHPDDPSDRTLAIDAAGRLYLDKQPIDLAALGPRLRTLFAARPDDRVLYLRADARVDYELVTTALDSARASGARVVGMIAERALPSRP